MSSPRKGNNPSPTRHARSFTRPSLESSTSSAWETIHSSNSSISISEASSASGSAKPQRPAFKKDSRPTSAIYLGEAESRRSSGEYSGQANGKERERGGTIGPKKPSPVLSVASGFASARVGLGSPQLDFRRDWTGAGARRREGSSESESLNQARSEKRSQVTSGSVERKENGTSNGLVDRVSGLPSPPGTESDIALPLLTKSGSSTDTTTKAASPSKKSTSPTRPAKRSSANSSPLLLSRRTSSYSGSSSSPSTSMRPADSPRLRMADGRAKGSPSISTISRTSSSSSGLVLSPKPSRQATSGGTAKRQSSDTSRHSSQTSGLREGSIRNSPTKRKQVQSLDLSRTSSFSSPERTARQILPLIENDYSDGDEAQSGHSRRSGQQNDEQHDAQRRSLSPRKSPGTDLDDRIREAEEKAREASRNGRRRSVEITETYTPVRSTIRRHDSYSRAQPSPLASTSTLRRSATLSSASALGNGEAQASLPSKRHNVQERRNTIGEEEEDRERSGGSGSSRRRKALPADFRQSGLFTPSPPKPKYGETPNDPPHSARSSKLRQFIDSPTDYPSSSPIPSRFASTSRLSGALDQALSPSRSGMSQYDGLERSASLAGTRGGETSGYSRRNWSQSISGLPRVNDELDHRGLPRYRAEMNVQRGSLDSQITQTNIRRGHSMLVNDRDLSSASRLRVTSIAPGDSISAVGTGSDRGDSKDPLDVVRRLEEQRVASRRRWHDIPRSATSMSSIKDVYNGAAPRTAPIERIASRISTDRDGHQSPSMGRGSSRMSMRGPATEPRPMRSSTSLGGRSSVTLDIDSASTEHGRLLFEAFRGLDSRIGQELAASQPDLIRTFHSAARTTETINATLRNAVDLASQIAVDAELGDPERVREEYSRLALLLREAGRASDQNVRDMTRLMLDIPKLLRQGQGVGSGMTGSTSAGSSRGIRRAQSVSLAFDPIKPGPASEERARRWQPTSPIDPNRFERSPLRQEEQGRERWSLDTPRRNSEMLRPATSIGESQSQSPLSRYNGNGRGGGGSTVASLMSRVRNMTPRKSLSSPKPELQTIQASPPQPQPSPKNGYDDDAHSSVKSLPRSPERTSFRNVLKKKASTTSTHTVRGSGSGGGGSSFFSTVSRVGPTTAISQVTAGDLNPDLSQSRRSSIDEPNSPMSKFSFNRQKERIRPRLQNSNGNEEEASSSIHSDTRSPDRREREEDEYFSAESYNSEREHNQSPYHSSGYSPRLRQTSDSGTGGDATSILEQNLVQAAKAREWEREQRGVRERLGVTPQRPQNGGEGGLDRRPSLSDRFRATLRKSSMRAEA